MWEEEQTYARTLRGLCLKRLWDLTPHPMLFLSHSLVPSQLTQNEIKLCPFLIIFYPQTIGTHQQFTDTVFLIKKEKRKGRTLL